VVFLEFDVEAFVVLAFGVLPTVCVALDVYDVRVFDFVAALGDCSFFVVRVVAADKGAEVVFSLVTTVFTSVAHRLFTLAHAELAADIAPEHSHTPFRH